MNGINLEVQFMDDIPLDHLSGPSGALYLVPASWTLPPLGRRCAQGYVWHLAGPLEFIGDSKDVATLPDIGIPGLLQYLSTVGVVRFILDSALPQVQLTVVWVSLWGSYISQDHSPLPWVMWPKDSNSDRLYRSLMCCFCKLVGQVWPS